MKNKYLILSIFFALLQHQLRAQTAIGGPETTHLNLFEYYHHTVEQEWVKLFTIKNYDPYTGNWGKGGVSGRLYFIDYQGKGGSYADFSFPQGITATQKPNITLNGNSAVSFDWYIVNVNSGPGLESYDVYIHTPPAHLGFSFLIRGSDYIPWFVKADNPPSNFAWSSAANPESFIFNKSDGNTGFGTMNPTEKLSVNGKIRAKEVKVETANWPDYVFEKGYQTQSLSELENYIKTNKHLPDIPTAKEVETNGVAVGDMLKLQQKKIEELTLHLIEKEKIMDKQQKLIDSQQKQLQAIENTLKQLVKK